MRLRLEISGFVQGVGFRPFVFRIARACGVAGWVRNSPAGATIEAEGPEAALSGFRRRLAEELPVPARIDTLQETILPDGGNTSFRIIESEVEGPPTALILPDLALCADCRRELMDPANRRHRHPFTNCTHCGPRFSIIRSLPYDRARTTMAGFAMCPACRAEYDNPADRRFHAQPNACPDCGPRVELHDGKGRRMADADDVLRRAAALLREGRILAVKGIGGFHLVVDAGNAASIQELRRSKHREEKPFALMAADIGQVAALCRLNDAERRLLLSPAAPIMLLDKLPGIESDALRAIAPGNPRLGFMLAYSPIHAVLLHDFGGIVVATSGNLAEEPICTDNDEAMERLAGIADFFLMHDRPIERPLDDSLMQVVDGRAQVLRRARGMAPEPVRLGIDLPPLAAHGAHLKNTVGISLGDRACLGQHIGDLENAASLAQHRRAVADLARLYQVDPAAAVCDRHPDYLSTREARSSGLPVVAVQHHEAHVWSVIAEHGLRDEDLLGVSWDGTGLGDDGVAWGGEFFVYTDRTMRRAATFRDFPLPGGDRAAREPRRAALGVLHELGLLDSPEHAGLLRPHFTGEEWHVLRRMLDGGIQCPRTTSVGRLFDALAALLDIRQRSSFEGQAAMEVEFLAAGISDPDEPPAAGMTTRDGLTIVDWAPFFRALPAATVPDGRALMAARWHRFLGRAIASMQKSIGYGKVVLTGGCFQNRLLQREALAAIPAGCRVYLNERFPCNDGGIALGQLMAAAVSLEKGE